MNRKKNIKKTLLKFLKPIKWFYPGMGVKRWLLFSFIGVILIVAGGQFFAATSSLFRSVGIIYMLSGIIIIAVGIRKILITFVTVLAPQNKGEVVDIFYQKRHLERGYKIVCLGGGTGLSTLLQGLKHYTSNITAIVTVTDDGGSSGRLMRDFDLLPPGDIRNCLVALADTEPLMSELFQYRFGEDCAFSGHSFGNIFLLAMTKVTKDFAEAVKACSKILAINGQVIPSTLKKVGLEAELEDGTKIKGETEISGRKNLSPIKKITLVPANCSATLSLLEAIAAADAVVLGPGSLYTSIIPNLLVDSLSEAINNSSAVKIYVCNVMTQKGETDDYKASDHLKAIYNNTKIKQIDFCIVNKTKISAKVAKRYAEEGAYQVLSDLYSFKNMKVKCFEGNFLDVKEYVRHNPKKLAKIVLDSISIGKSEAAEAV